MAKRHKKQQRLSRILGVGLLSISLGVVASHILPAAAETVNYGTLGYPHSSMPCAHAIVNGNCPGFDYGPVKDSDSRYSVATTYSPRKYGYRSCADYVAWKLQSQGIANAKVTDLGNGGEWATKAASKKLTVSNTPIAGSAAVKPGFPGHVAYVESVNGNGTITISEYNHNQKGDGDIRTDTASAMGFTKFVDFGLRPGASPVSYGGGQRKPTADVNADGTDDVLLMTKDGAPTTGANPGLSTGVGTWMKPQWWRDQYTDWDNMTPYTGDVTGDSKADLAYLIPTAEGSQAWVLPSTGDGFQPPQLWWNGVGYGYEGIKAALGDVDGNGAEDLILATQWNGTTIDIALSTYRGFISPRSWWSDPYTSWEYIKLLPGNINGDGNTDITYLIPTPSGSAGYVLMSTNQSFLSARLWWNGAGYGFDGIKPIMGDVDGNGYADMVLVTAEPDGGSAVLPGLSTGQSFWVQPAWWRDKYTEWNAMKPIIGNLTGDKFNGNTLDDIAFLVPSASGPRLWVLPSTHTGLQTPRAWWSDAGWGFDGIKVAVR